MITGDHPKTALAIGAALGLAPPDGEVHTGPEVDAMSDAELKAVVLTCNVYARASPENKIRIVKALQSHGQIVSMTGDGVNDAPSLKAANIGVAMGITGTDVSKEAAKIVLADDNFATIVGAVREGRRVWDNLRKVFLYNLPTNFAQGLVVFASLGLGMTKMCATARGR
jgi:P-type E1-E2 ATPase